MSRSTFSKAFRACYTQTVIAEVDLFHPMQYALLSLLLFLTFNYLFHFSTSDVKLLVSLVLALGTVSIFSHFKTITTEYFRAARAHHYFTFYQLEPYTTLPSVILLLAIRLIRNTFLFNT